MGSESITLTIAIIGAVCGVTGVVLGIVNTWRQLRRDKVRLKIVPSHVIPVGAVADPGWNFGIEVINMSEFPVTISDVGFLLNNGDKGTIATLPGFEQYGSLPLRLEPRTAFSKYFFVDSETNDWKDTKSAYALTLDGTLATGTSGALKQLIQNGHV